MQVALISDVKISSRERPPEASRASRQVLGRGDSGAKCSEVSESLAM